MKAKSRNSEKCPYEVLMEIQNLVEGLENVGGFAWN